MPRIAIPVPTPAAGDCFFQAISYAVKLRKKEQPSFELASQIRKAVAWQMAKTCFGKDLKTLTIEVFAAETLQGVKDMTPIDDEITQRWQERVPSAVPDNGNACPMAAWIVWLQYDVAEIAQIRKKGEGCAELRAQPIRFLDYTLWGETDVTGFVIEKTTKRTIRVFRDNDAIEHQQDPDSYAIYHTPDPHHFSAVRFVDPAEDAQWLETSLIDTYEELPVTASASCSNSKKQPELDLVLIKPPDVKEHASIKKSTSAQYSAAPMSLPRHEKALSLARLILNATKSAMGGTPVVTGFDAVPFDKLTDPPIFVISNNRSVWINKYFDSLFIGRLLQTGTKRAVIFMVDQAEKALYDMQLKKRPVSVVGLAGGFGMSWSRHCALKLARKRGLPKAWIFDDNVEEVNRLADVDDALLDQFPAFSYSLRGIMEQAVGFNLVALGSLNFCPFFPYNKDDLSLEAVLRAVGPFDHAEDTSSIPRGAGIRKTDKTTITSDATYTGAPINAYRQAIEEQIATTDIWRTIDNEAVDILKLLKGTGSGPRDVMKWHSDILWSILTREQKIAFALAKEWFTDAATPDF